MIEKTITLIIVLTISIIVFGIGYIIGRIHEKSLRSNRDRNPYWQERI